MRVTTLHSWFNANGKCCFSTYWHSAQSHASKFFFPLFGWSAKTSNCSPCLRTPIWASTICEKAIKAKHVHILDLCNYTSRNTSTGSCWCQWLVQSEEFKACLQCRTGALHGLDVSVFCRFITHQMSTKATQGDIWANQPAVTSPGWCVMHAAKTQALFENVMAAQWHCMFR